MCTGPMPGRRSIEALHGQLRAKGWRVSLRTLYGWSSRYDWQGRIAQLERRARAAEDAARIEAVREMQERQAREALLLQQRGAEWLTQQDDPASPEAAIRAIVEGARLERLVRGEATERTEQMTPTQERLEALSDEQLDDLLGQLAAGLEGEGAPPPD